MYIKKLVIQNFRCIENLTLDFKKGLNVLIGENNTGKSAIIDALRICLGWGGQKRDLYVKQEDFHINEDRPTNTEDLAPIEFHLYFQPEDITLDEAPFEGLTVTDDDGNTELQMHFTYWLEEKADGYKVRYKLWGGETEGPRISENVLELLYFKYLGALRNTEEDLKPKRKNILVDLLSKLESSKVKQGKMAKEVQTTLASSSDWSTLLSDGATSVNTNLEKTSILGKETKVQINFLPHEFRKILESLRIQVPVYETVPAGKTQIYFEIYQNGLGLNNLIYIATVLGDLEKRKK